MLQVIRVEIKEEYDIVVARVEAKEEARRIGFGIVDQTRIATAVSELARNIVEHGGGEGAILINVVKKVKNADRMEKGDVASAEELKNKERIGSERTVVAVDSADANMDVERVGLEIIAVDNGPGIEDIEKALEDGYSSTGTGLGIGLGGVKRLMDEFEIWSEVGKGTKVRVVKWMRK